ncbi:MAG: gas vesicle protein [Cyanobacteria bacterium P01_D01_bin.44]
MSQPDNFGSGFLLGTLVGGLLGGVIGALAASRLQQPSEAEEDFSLISDDLKRNLAEASTEEQMEAARRGLEDKIAQLNTAIEDVRQQLGSVNGHPEVASTYDPSNLTDS